MTIYTTAVHAGDRKKPPPQVPTVTPIYTASSYTCEHMEDLERVLAGEDAGYSYARYGSPTTEALHELIATLENGHGALACASPQAALETAIRAALVDRHQSVLASDVLSWRSKRLLLEVLQPSGCDINFINVCDQTLFAEELATRRPGCVLVETISAPDLRVPEIDRLAAMVARSGAGLVVDNTLATPFLVRPLELGANLVVHSIAEYLLGQPGFAGGLVVSDQVHYEQVRSLSRLSGMVLGPFESYITMQSIKTMPLRMEYQCAGADMLVAWLREHPRVARVNYLTEPTHPDAPVIRRLFPRGLYGALLGFDLIDPSPEAFSAFVERLNLIVLGASFGDCRTTILSRYSRGAPDPGTKDQHLGSPCGTRLELLVGLEAPEDLVADLDQALR